MNAEAVTDWFPVLPAVAALAVAFALAGYTIGRRHARRARRELSRALSIRSIELLEARAERSRLLERLAQEPPRERLLQATLDRLRASRRRERALFVDRARLRLVAADSARRARQAARLARLAAARARALEDSATTTGPIATRAAQSRGKGTPPSVGAIDRKPPLGHPDRLARVPRRKRARLTRATPDDGTRDAEGAGRDDERSGSHG